MATEYSFDKDVEQAMLKMVADTSYPDFAPLREHEVKMQVCICVRLDKNDENIPCKGDPTKVKKLSDMEKLFIKDADFIMVVNYSAWHDASSEQAKKAILHNGLMKMLVEPTDSGVKMAVRKPDVVLFSATLEQFGPTYSDQVMVLKDIMAGSTNRLIKELKIKN